MRNSKLGILITSQWDPRGVKAAEKSVEDLGKTTGKTGRVLDGVFAGMGISIANFALGMAGKATQAVIGFVEDSNRAFRTFEKQMQEVFTVLPGISAEAMNKMKGDVLELSKEIGRLPDETAAALYQALSSGVPADNVFEFLRESSKAARGGVTDLKTAVDAATNVVNAYGREVLSVQRANDLMFTSVQLGKSTYEELASTLYNVVPVAASIGVGFDQITAAMAAMTSQGVPTAGATIQLRQLLQELSKEGTKVSTVFETLAGKSFTQFIADGGNLAQALALLEAHALKTNVNIKDLFVSVEAGGAALGLTGAGAALYAASLEAAAKSAGATEAANRTMADSVDALTGRTEATTEALKIQVGEALEPATRAWLEYKLAMAQAAGEVFLGGKILKNVNEILREQTELNHFRIGAAADAIRVAGDEERSYARLRIALELLNDGKFRFNQLEESFQDALKRAIDIQEAATMRAEEMNRVYGELYGVTQDNAEAQAAMTVETEEGAEAAGKAAAATDEMLQRYLALPPAFWAVETSGKGAWAGIQKLRLEQEAAAAATERQTKVYEQLMAVMEPSMQAVDGYIDDLFAAQERLNSTAIWDVTGIREAKADMEEAFAGIAEAHRQMVLDIYVQNAGLAGSFDENAAKIAVALGLMTAEEAELRVQSEQAGQQIGFLADKLTKAFLEDGRVSRQEAELLSLAIGAIENGTITADEALQRFTDGSLADYLAGMEEGRTKTSLTREELLKLAGNYEIDVDSSGLDDAKRKVDSFPTRIGVTVDVSYNVPGYVPPGVPGVPLSTGGPVPLTRGATPGRDSVPAWLTPGEYVLTTAEVARLGGAAGVQAMLTAPLLGGGSEYGAAYAAATMPATAAPAGGDNYVFNVPDAANAHLIAQVVRDGRRSQRLRAAFGRGNG